MANQFQNKLVNLFSAPIFANVVINIVEDLKQAISSPIKAIEALSKGSQFIPVGFDLFEKGIRSMEGEAVKLKTEFNAIVEEEKNMLKSADDLNKNINKIGGGAKKAKEESKEFKEQLEQTEGTIDSINDIYEDFKKDIEKSNSEIDKFKGKIEELKEDLSDLQLEFQADVTADTEDFVTKLVKRRVDLQEKEKELQEEINELKKEDQTEEKLERIKDLQLEITDIQKEQADIQNVNDELAKRREETEKQLLETTDEDEKKILERRLEVLDTEAKFREELEDRTKSQTELEFEAFLRKIDLREQEYLREKEIIEERIAEQERFIEAEIENQRKLTFAWELTAQRIFDLNKSIVDQLNVEYQGLISTIKTAITESNKLKGVQGFAGGGFTGEGGMLEPAGIVHKNEWVAPSWMVNGMPQVFKGLEGARTGKTTNNKTINLNYKARIGNRADLRSEFNRLAWILR